MGQLQQFSCPELAGRKVVVTGAAGFIGQNLIRGLRLSGADVTALVRNAHGVPVLAATGARVAICPLTDTRALAREFSDSETVFHFAYDIRAGGTENLATFETVLAAARQSGVGQIVHASSVVVYDDWPNGVIDETSPIGSQLGSAYRQTKIRMEAQLFDSGLNAAILQPTIVYGPGSSLWTTAPMAALRKGGIVLPDPVGTCPLVYVDDVVQAALLAAVKQHSGCERFLVSGSDDLTWADFFNAYAKIAGSGNVILRPLSDLEQALGPQSLTAVPSGPSVAGLVSARLRKLLGNQRFESVVVQARRMVPGRKLALPDRNLLKLYAASPKVSVEKANILLGYAPKVRFMDGLEAIRDPGA